jgi:hypothetical protein
LAETILRPDAAGKDTPMTAIDEEYYERRAREERAAEKAAQTRDIAQVHAELAQQYEAMLKKVRDKPNPE